MQAFCLANAPWKGASHDILSLYRCQGIVQNSNKFAKLRINESKTKNPFFFLPSVSIFFLPMELDEIFMNCVEKQINRLANLVLQVVFVFFCKYMA